MKRAECQCGYVCHAKNTQELANMVAADGGSVDTDMFGDYELSCPACDEELEMS